MQSLLRITVLCAFATAGVALAVSVAAKNVPEVDHLLSADETVDQSRQEVSEPPAPVVLTPAPAAVQTPPPLLATAPPPYVASYDARRADRVDAVLDVLDIVRAVQQEQAEDRTLPVARLANQGGPAAGGNFAAGGATTQTTPEVLPNRREPARDAKVTIEADLIDIDAQDQDIRYILRLLSKAGDLNILASPSVAGNVSASLRRVPLEQALTALLKSTGFVYRREDNIIYVGAPGELQSMEHVAEQVDTRIYRPNYINAAELQKLLTPLLSTDIGRITVSTPAEVGIAADSDQAGGDSYVGDEVVMVRDYVSVLEEIDVLVPQVDRMPLQVAIEATILSVRLDDQDVFGVDFELLRDRDNIRLVSGTPVTSLATANFQDGLKVGFLDSSLFAFIEALETIGDTSVVASPRVTCLNKQRAEILIGSELGYVSTTVTETAATQAVEFLEVGTHLRIRPFISNDGMIRMEVHPELSTGSVRVQEGFTLPDKDVTQVTTNIMCRSGATMVIGGLIREDLSTVSTQIPVLGNLPLVGAVFRQRTEDIDRREVIVLLTPRIVDEVQLWKEGSEYSKQGRDRRDTFLDKMTPLGKRHYGERYARLATSAYAAGDHDIALRYANLAIHFDPLHQGAVNLRQEILAVSPNLETSVHQHLRRGLPPLQHPHRDYSRQGYPWKMETDPHGHTARVYIGDGDSTAQQPQAPITAP